MDNEEIENEEIETVSPEGVTPGDKLIDKMNKKKVYKSRPIRKEFRVSEDDGKRLDNILKHMDITLVSFMSTVIKTLHEEIFEEECNNGEN